MEQISFEELVGVYADVVIESIQAISSTEREKILLKTAKNLPDNPADSGMKASAVKPYFYQFATDLENSFYAYFNRAVEKMNDMLELIVEKVNEEYGDNNIRINSLISKIKQFQTEVNASYDEHTTNIENPHSVTKAQVGLGSVDNTADIDKPISTKTQTALDALSTILTTLKTGLIDGTFVVNKATNDNDGNSIKSTYETKADATTKHNTAIKTANDNLATAKAYTDAEVKLLKDALLGTDYSEAYDTFKEIADYIKQDESGASQMLAKINQNTSNIATNTENISKNKKELDAEISANAQNIQANAEGISVNRANIATNTNNIASNSAKIQELENAHDEDKTTLQTAINENSNDIEKNTDDIESLDARTTQIEDNINNGILPNVATNATNISNLQQGIENGSVVAYNSTKATEASNYRNANNELISINTAIENLKALINTLTGDTDADFTEITDKLSTFESKINKFFDEVGEDASAIDTLNDIKEELTTLETEINNIKTSLNNKADKIITNTSVTSVAVGGVSKGESLNGLSLNEIIEKIFFPYVAFKINISTNPYSSSVVQKGSSKTLTSVTANITTGSKGVTSIKLYENGILFDSITGTNLTSHVFSVNKPISASTIYKVEATDGTSTLSAQTSLFTFVDPFYYGVLDSGYSLTSALITGKTSDVSVSGTKTYNFTANGQHPFIAYPKSYGTLSSIKDSNNFEYLSAFTRSEMTLSVGGGSVAYYVYVQTETASISNFKYTFTGC